MSPHTTRISARRLRLMKSRGEIIPMITAYDYTQAKLVDTAGIPAILVGDSLGNVVLGHESTIPVTVDDMCRAIAAVVRGSDRAHIIGDMPFMSYQTCNADAMRNAARLMQEGGAQSVKLEGGVAVETIMRKLVEAGIPVMGHIGFTPQSLHGFGGYRVQGRGDSAQRVIEDAIAVERAGAYSVVLELMPAELAKQITEQLSIPTIGIGAGPHCDGQVQVFHDLMGMDPDFKPKHSGDYADLATIIKDAASRYADDVRERNFPTDAHSF